MKENRIKAIKITGICFAVLAAVFMIVIMFFLLAFFGAFGYDVQSLTLSYEEAQNVQFDLPFVKRPEGVFAANAVTVYTDGVVAHSHEIAKGNVICKAYSWQTLLDFFCVAKKDGSYTLPFNIDQAGEKVETCTLGDIFAFEENGFLTYYAEKDGVRYVYIPVNRTCTENPVTTTSVVQIFDNVFVSRI